MSRIFLTVFVLFNFVLWCSAQQIYSTKKGFAEFVSDAPLELIKASSDDLHGAVNLDDRTFAFSIDNKSFTGFNSPLQQEHFYENYMETDEFPQSTFKGKFIEAPDWYSEAEQVIRAKGVLNIHGINQERIIRGTVRKEGQKLFIVASFTVPLEDHQIKIPRVVYQKIAEEIKVTVRAELIPL
jgi:polyisoprenoid-binding protein YceI